LKTRACTCLCATNFDNYNVGEKCRLLRPTKHQFRTVDKMGILACYEQHEPEVYQKMFPSNFSGNSNLKVHTWV